MILNELRDQAKITLQNVKSHPKCLKSMTQFSNIRVVISSQQNYDVQIEKIKESLPNQNQKNYISYRFNRKQMKPETFVWILNGLEILSENKHFMKIDYVFILFEDFGQNLQELFQKGNFSIGQRQAKTSFMDIAKSLLLLEQTYSTQMGISQDFIMLQMNIYIDYENDSQIAHTKIIPFDFLGKRNELDINDLPKNFILSPELFNVINSTTSEQPLDIPMKKSNSYIIGLIFLQLLRGKKILGQSEREKEIGFNPQIMTEGPNDGFIKENLEKLIVKGKKNGLVLILEQCLLYNIQERIGYSDLHQICKNPLLFIKHKQIVGQLKQSQQLFQQQTKSYQATFKNILEEIQHILQESNGDIQLINQQFSTIKQEFESIDLPSFSEGDEISQYQKQMDQNILDSYNTIDLDIKNQALAKKKDKIERKYEQEKINSSSYYRSSEDQGKSRLQDYTQSDNKSDAKGNSVIKVRKIRNQDFYNPYGLSSNNHKVYDFSQHKDPKALLNKEQSIVDSEVIGIYSVLAINDYLVASCGDDASIKIWNMDDNKKECIQVLIGHSNSVHSLCLLQQSKVIASGSSGENASIKIWNISDGACIKTLKGHTDTISSICQISNDLLASGSYDSTIKIWRWSSAKCEKTLKQHNFAVLTVCPIDQNTICSGSDDCSIMIWDIKKGTMILDIQGHNSWVQNIIYLKKYNQIASCGGDGTVRIWNRSGQQENVFSDHDGQVNCLLYLEDKDILISAGSDSKINAYKLSSKKMLQKIEGAHKDSILSLASLGNTIVSSGVDSTISTWQVYQRIEKPTQSKVISDKTEKEGTHLPFNKTNIQGSLSFEEQNNSKSLNSNSNEEDQNKININQSN